MSVPRILAFLCAAGLLGGCAALESRIAPPRVIAMPNADFEADFPENSNCPLDWGCVMHNNPRSFRYYLDEKTPASGKRSMCIEPVVKESWARAVQASVDRTLRGSRLRLSMTVRVEGAESGNSEQGAGPFIAAQGGRGEYLAQKANLVKGPPGWQRLAAELVVPDGAFVLEYGVVLVGPGKVCIDDVRLEVVQGPKTPVQSSPF